jgi:glycine cleavage system aminomethyltransferase T
MEFINVIWGEREAEYFSREGWTGKLGVEVICPSGSRVGAQFAALLRRASLREDAEMGARKC